MSFKKINQYQDVFTNEFFINETVRFYYRQLSGSAQELNIHLPNHYRSGDTSGSYYLNVYDKPYNDISSNKLLSISYGYTTSSVFFSGAFSGAHSSPKITTYRMFAKRLLGSENKKFSVDGRFINEAIFLGVSRNQYKDFIIPRGTLMWYYLTGSPGREPQTGSFSYGVLTDYYSKLDSEFAGEITYLYNFNTEKASGIVFSKAGIVVLDPAVFPTGTFGWSGSMSYEDLAKGVSGTTHNDLLWSIKNRIWFWDFSGSQKCVETFYNCVAEPDEFNYSSNPSFVDSGGEIYTSVSSSNANSYITQVALLGENNEIIAIAKTRSPIRKNPDIGVRIRPRLLT
jgi:hypothetical protein